MARGRLSRFPVPIFFFVFTVLLYIPSEEYLGNLGELKVPYGKVVPYLLLAGAAVFAVMFLIAFLIRKKKVLSDVYIDLVFGFTLGMYVQSNFLNAGLEQLNGTEVVWNNLSGGALLSAAAWLLCLVLPHVIRRLASKAAEKITFFGSAALVLMQLTSYVGLLVSPAGQPQTADALSRDREFEMSGTDNVVVFVVDTLDAQWAEKYIIRDPQYAEFLEDFTYFDNVVSGGAPTILGIPAMLTGELYDNTRDLTAFIRQVNRDNTLFSDLKEKDFRIRLYTNTQYLDGEDFGIIDNAAQGTEYKLADPFRFLKSIYKVTAYIGMPYQLKKPFLIYSAEIMNNFSATETGLEVYTLDDPTFYEEYKASGVSLADDRPAFILYHFFGAHGPFNMNENAERVGAEDTSRRQQIQGNMKIISEIVEDMKRNGIYEASTIVITADHGGVSLYQNPAVFVKRKNDSHPFAVSSAPLTFRNLRATFAEGYIDGYLDKYGPGMFDTDETDGTPVRKHVFDPVLYKNVYPDAPLPGSGYLTCEVGNPARDDSLLTWESYETE